MSEEVFASQSQPCGDGAPTPYSHEAQSFGGVETVTLDELFDEITRRYPEILGRLHEAELAESPPATRPSAESPSPPIGGQSSGFTGTNK